MISSVAFAFVVEGLLDSMYVISPTTKSFAAVSHASSACGDIESQAKTSWNHSPQFVGNQFCR